MAGLRTRSPFLALAALCVLATAAAAGQRSGVAARPALALRPVGDFAQPTYLTTAPGFPDLRFVTERRGVIVVLRGPRRLRRPFLDISALVTYRHLEQGLVGLEFPPDYRRRGRFYVQYTDNSGDVRVDEFRRRSATVADSDSRRTLLRVDQIGEHPNHNGGQLEVRDGLLYIGIGDGANPGDIANQAQDLGTLRGKVLRIDPRPSRSGRPYRVPPSNPFVGRPGRDEIFSYGLRNPYRFWFQRLRGRPDRILIGDVGQNRFEEIDYVPLAAASGANFGWDAFEGSAPYDCGALCPNGGTPDPGGTVPPIHTYPHRPGACAVLGGYVVEDPGLPALRGRYVYGDYCGNLRSFVPRLSGATDDRPLGVSVPKDRFGFAALSSLGIDQRGRIYVMSRNGPLYRLVSTR